LALFRRSPVHVQSTITRFLPGTYLVPWLRATGFVCITASRLLATGYRLLGLFRTIDPASHAPGAPSHPALPGVGFVLHISPLRGRSRPAKLGLFVQLAPPKAGWPRDSSSASIPQSAIHNPQSAIEELGSFRTFDLTELGSFLQAPTGYCLLNRRRRPEQGRRMNADERSSPQASDPNHQSRGSAPGQSVPLPLLRVARIVPEFCARTRPRIA
jgi:hypothetical protein